MPTDMTISPDEEQKKNQAFQPVPVQQMLEPQVPTLGTGLQGMSRVIAESGVSAGNPDTGFVTGATPGAIPNPLAGPGRDESGVITAESAKRVYGNDMQREGGVSGGIDMAGANAIMARENKARGEMIDLSIAANGGNGIAILGDGGVEAANAEKTARWRQDELLQAAKYGNRAAGDAIQANAKVAGDQINSATAQRGQEMNFATEIRRQGITARGQDLNALSDATRNAVTMRGQDINANTDAQRLGIDRARLDISGNEQARATEKWGIERGILQGQAADSEQVRGARTELTTAIDSGDPAKVEAAKAKAVAAGIKFDKPNNEFTAVTNQMGGTTILNKDTGSAAIYNIEGKKVADVAAPSQKSVAAPASVPQGYTVVGTSGGKRVLQDAQGKRFVEGN